MERDNETNVSEFLLLGLPIRPQQQVFFYILFLSMYLTTLFGNLLIILLIRLDSRLCTPMYFLLSHLAFTDLCFSSVTTPKMLVNIQTRSQTISYNDCISQMYFFILCTDLDSFLLTAMAYDRYVAICYPLQYSTVMSQELCILLVVGSWILSCASSLAHSLLLARLSFCADNTIAHYFCELAALLKLSCSDVSLNELVIFTAGVAVITLPLICVLVSYICILATILKIPSTKGICKALSTCGSHLSVVSLYYGTIIGQYFFPSSSNSNIKDIIFSMMYTVVTPMLNPFIYTLRNKDINEALKKVLSRGMFSWSS
ncbi:olfactory receptor 1J2-like [Notamacropus eugenii]|uniref:olfactory receptor 1J2-like n=1 Tax=Notamacropus eugenii TaxID=9315 RepID=UPI003B67BA4C